MSHTDRMIRAIEALRLSASTDNSTAVATQRDVLRSSFGDLRSVSALFRHKESVSASDTKKQHCAALVDGVLAILDNAELLQCHLPAAVNLLILLSDDDDSHVRRASDECLNKIVNGFVGANVSLLLLELYKLIKQHGRPRVVSSALSKFSALADCISLQKRRTYAVNLVPCLLSLAARDDTVIQETIQAVFPRLSAALAAFFSESDTRSLLRAFTSRLSHSNSACRRVAACCSVTLISSSRCADLFLHDVLSSSAADLSCVRGMSDEHILGVVWCLRDLAPLMVKHGDDMTPSLCQQLWSVLLQYTHHTNHNVVTASVEALWHLLRSLPDILLQWLMLAGKSVSEESAQNQQSEEEQSSSLLFDDGVIDPLRYDSSIVLSPGSSAERAMQFVSEEKMEDGCVPLFFACKSLIHRFLLNIDSEKPRCDSESRVSVKVLVVNTISAAVSLMPSLLKFPLIVDQKPEQSFGSVISACISSVSKHTDPQLRGSVAMLCCTCLKWADLFTRHSPAKHVIADCLSILDKLLCDDNHVTVRLAVEAVSVCAEPLLHSCHAPVVPSLVASVVKQAASSYWLVKVSVCATLAALPLLQLHVVWSRSNFSHSDSRCDIFILTTFRFLLHDADVRVQTAAADAISRFCSQSALLSGNHLLTSSDQYWWSLAPRSPLFSHEVFCPNTAERCESGERHEARVTVALSSIVEQFVQDMMLASTVSSHQLSGCLLSMCSLMEKYSATSYPSAWQITGETVDSGTSLYQFCCSLLIDSHHMHSLPVHRSLLFLTSHLATGTFRYCTTRGNAESCESTGTGTGQPATARLLSHLANTLCLFSKILDKSVDSASEQTRLVLSSISSVVPLSPVKWTTRPAVSRSHSMSTVFEFPVSSTDGESAGKRYLSQARGSSPEYIQLYTSLKTMYASSQVSLSVPRLSHKCFSLLEECVSSLARVAECVDWHTELPLMEELLAYLSVTINHAPRAVVHCVHQLLRAMFGRRWSGGSGSSPSGSASGADGGCVASEPVRGELPWASRSLYDTLLNGSHTRLLSAVNAQSSGRIKKNPGCHTGGRSFPGDFDKDFLSAHIALFESVFSKALNLYTVCCDAVVQRQILLLLIELLEMNVSYDMIDREQMFVGFVMQQLGFIEEGQMRDGHLLIPTVFRYLILLSGHGNSGTTPISLAKVIQLSDGLIASALPVEQYVVPALEPIVHHIFIRTDGDLSSTGMGAHGEVVLNMMFHLVQHPQVMKLIGSVLEHCESAQLSEVSSSDGLDLQLLDKIVSQLLVNGVLVRTGGDLVLLQQFLLRLPSDRLCPSRHVVSLLLRPEPATLAEVESWALSGVSALLLLVYYISETTLLEHMAKVDLSDSVGTGRSSAMDTSATDSSAPSLQSRFIRLLFSYVDLLVSRLNEAAEKPQPYECLPLLLSQFLQLMTFIVMSGRYKECALGAARFVSSDVYNVAATTEMFMAQSRRHPLLLLAWCNLLSVLNLSRLDLWRNVLRSADHVACDGLVCCPSLPQELVMKGCLVLVCDCLCSVTDDCELLSWLLSEHVVELVLLSDEPPVNDLFTRLHRSHSASALLLQSISTRCSHSLSNALQARRVLQCVEGVASTQCGPLLLLIGRLFFPSCFDSVVVDAVSLACRKLEVVLAADEKLLSNSDFAEFRTLLLAENFSLSGFDRLLKLTDQVGTKLFGLSSQEGNDDFSEIEGGGVPAASHVESSDLLPNQAWLCRLIQSCLSWRPVCPGVLASCASLLVRLEQRQVELLLSDDTHGLDLLAHFFSLPSASDVFQQCDFDGFSVAKITFERHLLRILDDFPDYRQLVTCTDNTGSSLDFDRDGGSLMSLLPMFGAASAYLKSTSRSRTDGLSVYLASTCLLALQACDRVVSRSLMHSATDIAVLLDTVRLCLRCENVLGCLHCVETQCVVLFSRILYQLIGKLIGPPPEPDVDVCFKMFGRDVSVRICSLLMWLDKTDSDTAEIQPGNIYFHALRDIVICVLRLPLLSSLAKLPSEVYGHLQLTTAFISSVPLEDVERFDVINDPSPYSADTLVINQSSSVIISQSLIDKSDSDITNQTSTDGDTAKRDNYLLLSNSQSSNNRCLHSVPSEVLQEGDTLRRYIQRVETIGWFDRRDFEETWMTYLSVLNCSVEDTTQSVEEQAVLMQTQCLAVRGMTSLLLQTLTMDAPGHPNESSILHHSRHSPPVFLPGSVIGQFDEFLLELQTAVNNSRATLAPSICLSDETNIDRCVDRDVYGLGQLSLRYIRLSVSGREGVHSRREELLQRAGVDIRSCVVFLLQLYDTWLMKADMELKAPLLTEVVRSAVLLSDIMFESSQFCWLLDKCCALWTLASDYDEFTLALLTLGVCKMSAVLDNSDPHIIDLVKRVTNWGLQCTGSEPVRVHAVHGALYLLQLGPGLLSSTVLPPVFSFTQQHFLAIDSSTGGSPLDLVTWAAIVYLVRHYGSDPCYSLQTKELLHHACQLAVGCSSDQLFQALVKGLQQLVVCGAVAGFSGPLQLSIQLLQEPSTVVRLVLSTSLAFSCLYVVPSHHFNQESRTTALEIYSLLIVRIRSASPAIAEALSPVVTAAMLNFCPAAELINRVVSEFLSPAHSDLRTLAPAVFQVFGSCCSSSDRHLMTDWLINSLPSLTSHSSRPNSGWHLCCLMISASSNAWLRAAFPLLLVCASDLESCFSQRLLSYLFLVSASDFYHQIGAEKGAGFIAVIEQCASDGPVIYAQLLNRLKDAKLPEHS